MPRSMPRHRERLQKKLDTLLSNRAHPAPGLVDVMRYAVLSGGKRLRPMLAWSTAEALGVAPEAADIPACALEMVHCFSLVHDDLPAMDDDRLRRGQPTCHIRFGEAEAILAGDALQSLAFEILADSKELAVSHRARLKMISELASAIGAAGMAGGQSLDIRAQGAMIEPQALRNMHSLKTGALIRASVLLGARCSLKVTESEITVLTAVAERVGLAFQIRDDILDVTSDTRTLGKEQGRDVVLNKPTYVSALGMAGAEEQSRNLTEEALSLLAKLNPCSEGLSSLITWLAGRQY